MTMTTQINVKYASRLHRIFTTEKRIKIIVGGRGSTKSTGVADYVLGRIAGGELWCCAREFQNSTDESVHRTIVDEIDRLGMTGFDVRATSIRHESGGRNFYRGVARNITSFKSTLSGVDGLWVEEAEDCSDKTLKILTASVRLNARDAEKKLAGEVVKMPEIIMTMNRGSRGDPISQKWLKRAEPSLERQGWYEDEAILVVELNYTHIPKKWFVASGLEVERADDFANMSRAAYDAKWLGKYNDEVEDSIILSEWFDAAIDAHIKLGFKPRGARISAFDPSDGGDSAGYVLRHGQVILDVDEMINREVNDACDWALEKARNAGIDEFIWDCDGLGVSLRGQISETLAGTKIGQKEFRGGSGVSFPHEIYQQVGASDDAIGRTNDDTFKNQRAQRYWGLRDMFYATYRAVVKGEYIDPDKLISVSSEIQLLEKLRSEICRIPRKRNNAGMIQIMSKAEMKSKHGIESPNLSDAVMMAFVEPAPVIPSVNIKFTGWSG